MNERSRLTADLARRIATIEGQLKGIDRLLQKQDVPQTITQCAAVRNALESLVRLIIQAAIMGRFATASVNEQPEDAFGRALERAMTYWFAAGGRDGGTARVLPGEAEFWVAARREISAVQGRLRDMPLVLEGDNYLHALPQLGAMVRQVDELLNVALCRFIKDRTAGKPSSRKARDLFEQAVAHALKYWHLPAPKVPASAQAVPDAKILAVDDDPDVLDYLTHVLAKNGYRVVTAPDADEAMRRVVSERPDLIILDIMMPKGTEGFHFTWDLRARPEPECRNTPILVLTAIHETMSTRFYPEQSDSYYGPGEFLPVEGFIDKPVQEEDLLREVERILKRPRAPTDRSRQAA